jgi:hypothetical protein
VVGVMNVGREWSEISGEGRMGQCGGWRWSFGGVLVVLWWWVGEFGSAVRCGSDDVQRKLFGARGRLCWISESDG